MINKQVKTPAILFLCLLLSARIFGQYTPDTTLTYSTFLKQCQEFSRQNRDEVWVVNFWQSQNGASLYTLPELKQVYLEHLNKPVRFISISVDKVRANWERRLPQYQMPWEQIFLPVEADYTFLKNAFRHNSLPAIFVVSSDAQVQRVRDVPELRTVLALETRDLPNTPYQASGLSDLADAGLSNNSGSNASASPPRSDLPEGSQVVNGWITHRVKTGETLFSLYRKYGVGVSDIKRINGLTSNTIKVGQVLKMRKI